MVASLKAGSRRTKRARKPSGQYHHGDLHQALIAAALSEIEASGADSISLAALAKSLAVSQAAPYRHFADRDALLQAIAEEGFHLFTLALKRAAQSAPPRNALHDMSQAYVDFALSRPGLYRLMFASRVLATAPPGGTLHRVATGSFQLLVDVLPEKPAGAARIRRALKIWAGLHGLAMLAQNDLLEGELGSITPGELVRDIVE
jgi:AcrR family transcriptional regulator